MSETDELLREIETDTEVEQTEPSSESAGLRSRAASRAGQVFAPRAFLVAAALSAGGLFLADAIPFLSNLPVVGQAIGLLGIFAGSFVHGAVAGESRYAEAGVAGGVVAGLAGLSQFLAWTLVGIGVPIVAVLGLLGVVAGLLGHYFGRDLRDGLTRDI